MSPVADRILPSRAGSTLAFARRAGHSRVVVAPAVYAAALAWTLLVRVPLWRMDGPDDAFYVEVAHLWTRGVLPYVGAFDVKPPGFFAILAAAQTFMGVSLDSLRAVAVAFDALAATALFFLARRFGGAGLGLFAALLYPVLSGLVTSNDAYAPLAALTDLAFLAALSPQSLMKRAALTGLLIGAAGAIKQTAGFEAVALLAIVVSARDGAGRRSSAALAFFAAAALAPLGFLAYFASHGATQALFDDAVLGALARPASANEGLTFADGVSRFFLLQKSVVAIFGFACLALLRRRALKAALPSAPLGALEAWFAFASLSIVAQRSIAITYLGPTLAPGLILAGLCLTRATPELNPLPAATRLVALGLASLATAIAIPGNDPFFRQEARALEAAAAAIRASGPTPDDKLYVVNRGAWLYSALDLPPPTKYFYPGHTLCDFQEMGPRLIEDILAAEPRYLVVADRRLHYVCEKADRWRVVEAVLERSYRPIAHAAGQGDAYDVYEAVGAPTPAQ
ncbi:MAG TPA: glycosyltransferase family 39 protein [Roseiarcus sp.]|nr:glycosyltransferase family 39 protein [Roseiarcus sp.]